MPLFTLDPAHVDWSKTKDLGTIIVATYAAVLSTITAIRGKKTIVPKVELGTKGGKDGETILQVYLSNEGTHQFSVRKVVARGHDKKTVHTFYDAADDDADSISLSSGGQKAFAGGGQWYFIAKDVRIALNNGKEKIVEVEGQKAQLYQEWHEAVDVAIRSVMVDVHSEGPGLPIKVYASNGGGGVITYTFDPFKPDKPIGNVSYGNDYEFWNALNRLADKYPFVFDNPFNKIKASWRMRWTDEVKAMLGDMNRTTVDAMRKRMAEAKEPISEEEMDSEEVEES